MIKRFTIKSFKSIKSLEFECNRINVFIGPPNTGKSNILEVLSYLSFFFRPKSKQAPSLEDFIQPNKYQNIKQAFDVLSNPKLRQEYNQQIKNKNNSSNKNSKELLNSYTFKEKKTHISVIV